ncbi:hypothetical protein KCK34_000907 [Clostridium perfringens]|nr:hypothetical protein [Clostridium perfringens]
MISGKILSWYTEEYLKNLLKTNFEEVNELAKDVIEKSNFREYYRNYLDVKCKANMYLTMTIASVYQLIISLINNSNQFAINLCLLTITISFIEYRDNKKLANEKKEDANEKQKNIINIFIDIKNMKCDDIVFDDLENKNLLTKEDRLKLIKEMKEIDEKYRIIH